MFHVLYFLEDCPADQGYMYYPTENFCVKLNTTKIPYLEVQYNCVLERATTVRVDTLKKLNILQSYLGIIFKCILHIGVGGRRE